MRIALLSDIHSNLQALQACLRHAKKQGVDRYAVLGDLVGYGGDPVAVVERVAKMRQDGAIVLMGNHDEAVIGDERILSESARQTALWTRQQLSSDALKFLGALPLDEQLGNVLLVHASAYQPEKFHYLIDSDDVMACIKAADARESNVRLVAVGHVHEQRLWHYSGRQTGAAAYRPIAGAMIDLLPTRRWVATIGSVGQPRDGNPAASYAIVDLAQSRISFFRVPYDHAAAAEKIRRRHAGRRAEGVSHGPLPADGPGHRRQSSRVVRRQRVSPWCGRREHPAVRPDCGAGGRLRRVDQQANL